MGQVAQSFHISGRQIGGRGGFIPGTSGRSIPGSAKLPSFSPLSSGFLTNIKTQPSSTGFREFHFRQVRNVRGQFAGGFGFAWQGLAEVNDNLLSLNDKLHKTLKDRAEALKDEMVAYAKDNAPWDDDTTLARTSLQGAVVWSDEDHFQIYLGHGAEVYYGIWLEVRWGGRYAIIVPTIEEFRSRVGGILTGGPA